MAEKVIQRKVTTEERVKIKTAAAMAGWRKYLAVKEANGWRRLVAANRKWRRKGLKWKYRPGGSLCINEPKAEEKMKCNEIEVVKYENRGGIEAKKALWRRRENGDWRMTKASANQHHDGWHGLK